jgi:Flp pilus assembly protein protease CpaA
MPLNFEAAVLLVALVPLAYAAIADARTHQVPKRMVWVIILCGCAKLVFLTTFGLALQMVVFLAFLACAALPWLLGFGFGGGDLKILGALGLVLPTQAGIGLLQFFCWGTAAAAVIMWLPDGVRFSPLRLNLKAGIPLVPAAFAAALGTLVVLLLTS